MKIEEMILSKYDDLNDTDLMIWRYIIENKHNFDLTIDELAGATHVSHTTISRFVKKLGLNGYSEFKVLLKHESNDLNAIENQDFDGACDAVVNYVEQMKKTNFDSVCKYIYEADRVYIYGSGDIQRSVAKQIKRMFVSANELIHNIDSSTIDKSYFNMIDEKSVVIMISLSGNNDKVIDIARKMKIKGAKIISITEFKINQLTKISDESLYISSVELNFLSSHPDYQITMMYYILAELLFIKYSIYKKNRMHLEGLHSGL